MERLRVLFLGTGNSARSQIAEGLQEAVARTRGRLQRWNLTDSRGTPLGR